MTHKLNDMFSLQNGAEIDIVVAQLAACGENVDQHLKYQPIKKEGRGKQRHIYKCPLFESHPDISTHNILLNRNKTSEFYLLLFLLWVKELRAQLHKDEPDQVNLHGHHERRRQQRKHVSWISRRPGAGSDVLLTDRDNQEAEEPRLCVCVCVCFERSHRTAV